MPKVNLTLEPEQTDFRGQQVSFQLIFENNGTAPLELLSASPRIPNGADLLDTRDVSTFARKTRHTKLCEQLTLLTRDVLLITDESIGKRLAEVNRKGLEEILSVGGIMGIYLSFFRGTFLRQMETTRKKSESLFVKIESAADATRVYDELIAPLSDTSETVSRAFKIKADKLAELEKQIGANHIESVAMARVEPGSQFRATYVVQFPRYWLETSHHSMSVEAGYREDSSPQTHNAAASAIIRIAPKPFVLTAIAVVSATLGVVLKHALVLAADADASLSLGFGSFLPLSETMSAMILALIFFNVFEFTDLLKGFRRNLGWRTALLIGVLCGLGSDRIVAAVQALVGLSS